MWLVVLYLGVLTHVIFANIYNARATLGQIFGKRDSRSPTTQNFALEFKVVDINPNP